MRWYFVENKIPPVPSDWPFYCPQNTTGFYTIDFNTNLSFTTTNYCPQNNIDFYTISYSQNLSFTTTNYCPQTTTGFYDFAQSP